MPMHMCTYMSVRSAIAAKAYDNGNKNPLAHMHAMQYKEGPQFLSNKEYRPFLRVTDCSQVFAV